MQLFCVSFCHHNVIYILIGLRIIFLMSEGMIEVVQGTKQRLIVDKGVSEVDIFAAVYNVYNIVVLHTLHIHHYSVPCFQ